MSRILFVVFLAGAALTVGTRTQAPNAPGKRISVSVDAGKTGTPISLYVYGQFIEHIGDLINRSLWAEMLDDRKFYYDIDSKPSDRKPVRVRVANLWRPIGPDESVAMDRKLPYVGDHTPLIGLGGAAPRGTAGRYRLLSRLLRGRRTSSQSRPSASTFTSLRSNSVLEA